MGRLQSGDPVNGVTQCMPIPFLQSPCEPRQWHLHVPEVNIISICPVSLVKYRNYMRSKVTITSLEHSLFEFLMRLHSIRAQLMQPKLNWGGGNPSFMRMAFRLIITNVSVVRQIIAGQ
jgi:hypothetical protein